MGFVETMTGIKLGIELWRTLGLNRLWEYLRQPIITVVLGVMVYAGYYVVHERSVIDGLYAAFLESRAEAELRVAKKKNEITTDELIAAGLRQKLINNSIHIVVERLPRAARARLALLHVTGKGMPTGPDSLRYDLDYSIPNEGYAIGEYVHDSPLVGFDQLFNRMSVGDYTCESQEVARMAISAARERLARMGVTWTINCPIRSARGRFYGFLFVHYSGTGPTDVEDLITLREAARVGYEVGAILEIDPWR